MHQYFTNEISRFELIASDAELRINIIANLRLLLQQIDYGLLEWIVKKRPAQEFQPSKDLVDALYQPADGTLVDALEGLLICCEQLGWAGACRAILLNIPIDNPALDLVGAERAPTLIELLRAFIEIRNGGAEGHGLPGGYKRVQEIAAYAFIVNGLQSFIPKLNGSAGPSIGVDQDLCNLEFLPPIKNNRPQLIRKIKIINGGKVRMDVQSWDGVQVNESSRIERINIFKTLECKNLQSYTLWDSSWEPLCYIPERPEIFSGREMELNSLFEWANDADSWACLVFGDGGLGKTTLVIEFVHRLLNDDPRVEWKPKVISFYTAKKTQWGVNGLETIKAGQPHLSELVRHLYTLALGQVPSSEYYRKDVLSTASMLQTKMNESGFEAKRQDHLIVIDNAETLIDREEDHIALGKELKEITKKLGRVLVTSRRHERFNAEPIEIGSFSKTETLEFLRERGRNLNIDSIKKATDQELLDATLKMGNRPLVLEVFVLTLTDPTFKTLTKAKAKVESMLGNDLGTFLFADAWRRFSSSTKKLLLLITSIADVCDGNLFKICAVISNASLTDAERSLEESKGIASVSNISGNLQIIFSQNFLQFAEGVRLHRSGSAITIKPEEVGLARSRYQSMIEAAQRFSGDRIVQAFRTPIAKAAYSAKKSGDFTEALRLYEQAILTDSNNAWLFDRYAYFLFHDLRDMDAALSKSKKAVELLPNESEVWLTRGLIESRLGDIRAAENSLDRAEGLGAPKIRCDLQRCWAYLKAKPVQMELARTKLASLESQIKGHLSNSREKVEIDRLRNRLNEIERRSK
jgi:hypothetical protein